MDMTTRPDVGFRMIYVSVQCYVKLSDQQLFSTFERITTYCRLTSSSIRDVADVCIVALSSQAPLARYIVGLDAWL